MSCTTVRILQYTLNTCFSRAKNRPWRMRFPIRREKGRMGKSPAPVITFVTEWCTKSQREYWPRHDNKILRFSIARSSKWKNALVPLKKKTWACRIAADHLLLYCYTMGGFKDFLFSSQKFPSPVGRHIEHSFVFPHN
jgi:hypothetical protein